MRKFLLAILTAFAFLAAPVFADDIGVGKNETSAVTTLSTDDDIGVGSWYELLLSWIESDE